MVRARIARLYSEFFYREIDVRQYAALRIVFGLLTLATLVGYIGNIALYFSGEGWLSSQTAYAYHPEEWSLLYFISSAWAVRAFFGALVLATIGLTLGFQTRLLAILCFIGMASLHGRNELVHYEGDNVLRLMLFYLAIAPSGRTWSIDSLSRKQSVTTAPVWPLRLIQFQIIAIYLSSGLAKLHGADWLNGSAIGLTLLNPIFARWDWVTLLQIKPIEWTIRFMTWLTLAWEISFPFLIFSRRTRHATLAIGVFIHLGTLLFLQIHWFGPIMIATYLALIPDTWFKTGLEKAARHQSSLAIIRRVWSRT